MKLLIALCLISGYFVIWVYTYILVLRAQKSLFRKFPEEAERIIGTEKIGGINKKTGLLFLWQEDVKEIGKKNKDIELARKRAIKYLISLLIAMPLIPFLTLFLWLLVTD
jgi:hypothetical protein